jgi:putative endonuclease
VNGTDLSAPCTGEALPRIFWLYIVRCADGTLYTGIATDVVRRLAEHNGEAAKSAARKGKGARYTASRRPVALVYHAPFASRSCALKEEVRIKRLTRAEKLVLIANAASQPASPA